MLRAEKNRTRLLSGEKGGVGGVVGGGGGGGVGGLGGIFWSRWITLAIEIQTKRGQGRANLVHG